ncbi:hypothetical protein PITC_068080 [Penicillium italicum]|uniref:Uncharacterized protein n=1 Tax=Penicillium italicum TaxID=40296 RepID=A0A0A2LEX7_PENIT|nr:hypothetical protein PITC_068080 [Penicillium italicum]
MQGCHASDNPFSSSLGHHSCRKQIIRCSGEKSNYRPRCGSLKVTKKGGDRKKYLPRERLLNNFKPIQLEQ